MPTELDELRRRVMQMEIEEMALKKEDDQLSRDRLAKLTQELAELKDRFNEQKARWESEKNSVEEVKSLKADIDRLHAEIEEAQRNYEYEKAARLQYSDLPSLEKKLSEAEAAADVTCDFSGTEEGLNAYWPLTLNVGSEITDMTGRHVAKMTDVKWTDPE